MVVVTKSNVGGTGKIQFSLDGTTWLSHVPFTYTANDTLTNRYIAPIVLPYIRVTYTNDTTAQTTFSLTTTFINSSFSINAISDITIGNIGSITGPVALPTGAATFANQTTQIAKEDSVVDMTTSMNESLNNIEADADSTVDMVTAIHSDVDAVEAKLDSLDASSTRIETKLNDANAGIDSLDASSTRIEGYVDNVEAKIDSVEASINATNLALIEVNTALDSVDASTTRIEGLVTNSNTKLDSLDASGTRREGQLTDLKTKLDSIDASSTRIEEYVDNLEPKLDSLEVTENLIQTNTLNSKSLLDSVRVDFTRNHNDLLNIGIKVDSVDATASRSETKLINLDANQTVLLGYQPPSAINWGSDSVSVTTSVDSLTFSGATVKWKLRIFSLDGTIIVSTDPTFATNKRIAYAWTEIFPYENMSVVTYPKIYFKASSGTVKINYSGEGY